ncbi:DUF3237 domain-containing protein [soil metagenome]
MVQPKLEFVFELRVDVSEGIRELGTTPKGIRRIIPLCGGSFEGPSIKGTILPGGYDWQLIRSDGVAEIEVRYVLKTDDDTLITVMNTGLRHATATIMERMAKGEELDPSLYYFRSVPVFETSVPNYDWLSKNIFIANGIRQPNVGHL